MNWWKIAFETNCFIILSVSVFCVASLADNSPIIAWEIKFKKSLVLNTSCLLTTRSGLMNIRRVLTSPKLALRPHTPVSFQLNRIPDPAFPTTHIIFHSYPTLLTPTHSSHSNSHSTSFPRAYMVWSQIVSGVSLVCWFKNSTEVSPSRLIEKGSRGNHLKHCSIIEIDVKFKMLF